MALLVAKAHHLVLDRRAVARAAAVDHAGVHRRAIEAAADNLVGRLVGERQVAGNLRLRDAGGAKGERRRRLVTGLDFERRIIDRTGVEARTRSGLEASDLKTKRGKAVAETHRGEVARAARVVVAQSDMDQPLQECSSGQDDSLGGEDLADLRFDGTHGTVLDYQPLDAGLADRQVGRRFEHALHAGAVGGLVGLRAAGAHGRALAGIEEAKLDSGFVDRERHLAAERVDFTHQMALADAADGGIARHLADMVEVEREHQRARAHPGGR